MFFLLFFFVFHNIWDRRDFGNSNYAASIEQVCGFENKTDGQLNKF